MPTLPADLGSAQLHGRIDGLVIPGEQAKLLQSDPITLDASGRLDDPARTVMLSASHRLFALKVQAITAKEQSAIVELRLPNVAPLAQLGGQKLDGSALINAQLDGYPALLHIKWTRPLASIPTAKFGWVH